MNLLLKLETSGTILIDQKFRDHFLFTELRVTNFITTLTHILETLAQPSWLKWLNLPISIIPKLLLVIGKISLWLLVIFLEALLDRTPHFMDTRKLNIL